MSPQEHPVKDMEDGVGENLDGVGATLDGDRIVISGMSGIYPQTPHVNDLCNNLYNQIAPVSKETDRWTLKHPGLTNSFGQVSGLDRFDAQFFKVNVRFANSMDAMMRKVLEQAYQAIFDAGISPNHYWGKKVGVYLGSCASETEKYTIYDAKTKSSVVLTGCSKPMFANRISYWINSNAPSYIVDTACCSSISALEMAYNAISRGECEAAIVGGTNACLHPQSLFQYSQLLTLSKDGNTKSFDQNADGCVFSETMNVLFLQKAKDARRIYAEIVHVKSEFHGLLEDNNGPRHGYYRNPDDTAKFIERFYHEANVLPQAVEYVEAFGAAIPEADKAELQAIEKVYCKSRTDPLLVGSVMTNVGYSGAASGVTAITKVLLGYHTGQLAANLHCENPLQDIPALREGRMRIITENQPFRRTYAAINSMSYTGINAHVLLHGFHKAKDIDRYNTNIPRLVTISGRQESAVERILDHLKSGPLDPEEIALLHNIHESRISGHLGRGFTILDTNEEKKTVSLCQKVDYFDDNKHPLWFVYSGMGSQWAGMGAQLMRLPMFAAAIERCHKVLKPLGIDIVEVITSPDSLFDNIIHSFVGIAAIQIGLTDVLKAIGLSADKTIGHSAGELGCAYADGCFTIEETILVAYVRGLVSVETPFIPGSMAAVGIGYQEMRKICPPEIVVACHNGPDSCTLSGPADCMREFIAKLTAKQIFAKEVPCSNIAYHSHYVAHAGPILLKHLQTVIKNPKPRSERWLSTSVPQDKWGLPEAKFCSAEYQVNNMLNAVLFEEVLRLVPQDAVLLEIAPHGLLQAILKRSLPPTCRNISLTRRAHPDNALLLLQAVGELYLEGYNPKIQALYPTVEFPVSTGTPLLSHLVEWTHHEKWSVPLYASSGMQMSAAASKCLISIHEKEHAYLRGHVVKGKTLYPFAAALVMAWDTLAMTLGVARKGFSVHFTDIQLYGQPVLRETRPLRLSVALHRGTGRFEITEHVTKVADGYINANMPDVGQAYERSFDESNDRTLDTNVVYQALYERDYSYRGEFRSIRQVNQSLTQADIAWSSDWVTFLDGILQFNMLRHSHATVSQISHIRRLCIDLKEHAKSALPHIGEKTVIRAYACDEQDYTRCGGVLLNNIRFRDTLLTVDEFDLKPLKIVPNVQKQPLSGNVILQSSRIGDLDSLHWVEGLEPVEQGVAVTVHYVGISNLDVHGATGVLPSKSPKDICYGMDFSGVTENGDRVMGLLPSGAASSSVQARPDLLWPVPAHWSLEDAATVPLAYAHAFYCLAIKSLVVPNISILVHGGAGALGQATISIALGLGYQVFTTVSDLCKKRFLCRLFPELKEAHIGNSRDQTFGDMIMNETNTKGCDVVICCLKGDLKNISLRCCGPFGVVLDTAQVATRENYDFGMDYLSLERNYVRTDFSSIFEGQHGDTQRLQYLLSEGIARGYVRPLSRVTYEQHEVPRAFRLLATSRHYGRVLLRLKDSHSLFVQSRLACSAQGVHLVVCEDGLLGMQLVELLISRSAKNVHLHCELPLGHQTLKTPTWQRRGVNVKISSEKLIMTSDVTNLLKTAAQLGVLEGLYYVQTAVEHKLQRHIHVAADLDKESRKLFSSLRYFAVVATDESVGLTTCLARLKDGLPATLLKVPELDVSHPRSMSWYRSIAEATRRALHGTSSVIVASHRQPQSPSLLAQLASVTDTGTAGAISTTTTLENILSGLEDAKLERVSSFLQDVHNVFFTKEQIMSLTEERLNQVEESLTEPLPRKFKGLQSLFNHVDSDELRASHQIVFLPTLVNDTSTDNFDVTQPYLCLIPGLEGHHERFRALCECLKLPVLVLQPGFEHVEESPRDSAQRLAKVLLEKGGIQNSFYLLGYECGILVSLEIASILEEQGATGTVFCLGGGPDEVVGEIQEQLRRYGSEVELQDAVLRHMFALLAGGPGLEDALRGLATWPLKLEACVRLLLSRVPHSAQYTRSLIQAVHAKIAAVRGYTAQPRPLRSRIVLLRASYSSAPAPSVPKLQQYSEHPIAVHQLTGCLAHAPADLRCAAIINDQLGAEVLAAFERRNICVTYNVPI